MGGKFCGLGEGFGVVYLLSKGPNSRFGGGLFGLWMMSQQRGAYPLVMADIAIKTVNLWWVFPENLVIFHSYVSLPEGKGW